MGHIIRPVRNLLNGFQFKCITVKWIWRCG